MTTEEPSDAGATADAGGRMPRKVIYCGVCTLPPEYCGFGGTKDKCEQWLLQNHPDMHAHLYSEEALAAATSHLSVSAREAATKDAAKKAAKAANAAQRDAEKRAAAKVQIKRVERNKRKHVTEVRGLEAHGLELKKVAKEFGKKFACGSSVTKRSDGLGEEITIQGDVAEEVLDWILEECDGKIPEDNVDIVEDTKKKSAG